MDSAYKRVSIHWVKGILAAAESLGVSSDEILSELDFTLDLENNKPTYLSLDQTQEIWARAESLSAHDFFGLRMGQRGRPSYFHAAAYVTMTSQNLLSAFENFTKYMPLVSEAASLKLSYEADKIWLHFTPKPDSIPFSRHQHESVMALLLAFSSWMVGDENIAPSEVYFSHEAGPDLMEYQKVFGLMPKFNQEFTGIQFSKELLDRPLVEGDVGLNQVHKEHADQLLEAHLNTSWKVKVIQLIVESADFNLNREQVARHLNISTRTLQRRLHEEGSSFLELMDAQRKQKAQHLICNTQKSLKEVALILGFSESSTFYRACHRWFNSPPNAMREKSQAD